MNIIIFTTWLISVGLCLLNENLYIKLAFLLHLEIIKILEKNKKKKYLELIYYTIISIDLLYFNQFNLLAAVILSYIFLKKLLIMF
jgi:hypothetical protein